MTLRQATLATAALLALMVALGVHLATTDLETCWPDCRERFADKDTP